MFLGFLSTGPGLMSQATLSRYHEASGRAPETGASCLSQTTRASCLSQPSCARQVLEHEPGEARGMRQMPSGILEQSLGSCSMIRPYFGGFAPQESQFHVRAPQRSSKNLRSPVRPLARPRSLEKHTRWLAGLTI